MAKIGPRKTSKKKTAKKKGAKKKAAKKRAASGKKKRNKASGRSAKTNKKRSGWRLFSKLAAVCAGLLLAVGVITLIYTLYLDRQISGRFVGQPWQNPARVYARAVELYAGKPLHVNELEAHLEQLGYRRVQQPTQGGEYTLLGARLRLITRQTQFNGQSQASVAVDLRFSKGQILSMLDGRGSPLPFIDLDPLLIGSIIPKSGEDRIVVGNDEVPSLLKSALVAVEDRNFMSHFGVDPRGILRAAWANFRAGQVEQGGSTITQQLIKSHFLSNEQTWRRKIKEALMALALDARMQKQDIMIAYINEIYLGQDGNRAIHGFDLASRFYFHRTLSELEAHEIATLVAIVRGPSYYNPRRYPERTLARRNQVLSTLVTQQILSEQAGTDAINQPLGVQPKAVHKKSSYPAFLALVKQQLLQEYEADDLSTEGLSIHTTLDVLIQERVEDVVSARVAQLEQETGLKGQSLQSSVVLITPDTGELVAVMGGRAPGFDGFNRALTMRRPIGSLMKPFVFLSALETERYDLDTKIDNQPLSVPLEDGQEWQPKNYTDEYSEHVPMFGALMRSINVATVRVGLEVGLDHIQSTLQRAGLGRSLTPYPSMLLGATEMSPVEVAQLYLSLTGNGFVVPIRTVNSVTTGQGKELSRYPLSLSKTIDPVATYQTVENLKLVTTHGTARAWQNLSPSRLQVAGKTGSTNDLRDSWFAGFSQDLVTVVWLGNDDNEPIGLTGSKGAMPVWAEIMNRTARSGLDTFAPSGITSLYLNPQSGDLAVRCDEAVLVPLRTHKVSDYGLQCSQ